MTTTAVNYQAIVTAATDGELSLGIVYNDRPEVRDMAMTELHRRALEINTEVTEFLTTATPRVLGAALAEQAHIGLANGAVVTRQAIRDELHTRALREYTAGGTESPKTCRDRTRRTAPACTIATLNQDAEDRQDGYTRRVALDQLQALAIIEYAATKGHPRAVNYVALQQAVGHLADLVRKYKLDGEDIHTLVCAIDGDGATTPETYWGEDLTDTFAYLVNYCTVLDESAETLLAEVGLALEW